MTEETQAPSQGTEAPPVPENPVPVEAAPSTTEGEAPPEVPQRVVPAADGYQFEEGTPDQLGTIFNKLDMTQEQAAGVIQMDQARTQAQAAGLRKAGEEHIEAWGDAAQTNLNLAKRGMNHFDPTGQLKQVLNETGFGNDPRLLEMFYQFGQRMEEGGFLPTEVNTPGNKSQDTAHMWYPDQKPGNTNPYNS